MTTLFHNAVMAIQLGVEDFGMDTPARSLSAARNFYSGALLLAKEVLSRHAPTADLDDILAAKYRPVPDGKGGINFEPIGHQTIDFRQISERFKTFKVDIGKDSIKRLEALGRLRNDIEHKYTDEPHEAVQAAIGRAFPTVLELFYLCGENPQEHLGVVWQQMVEIKEAYDLELAACIATFSGISFFKDALKGHPFYCSSCDAELVSQLDPSNTSEDSIVGQCRLCGEKMSAETAICFALRNKYRADLYEDISSGSEETVSTCPECSQDTYVLGVGCVWCQTVLGECIRCGEGLTPNTVSWVSNKLCDYCGHIASKDD